MNLLDFLILLPIAYYCFRGFKNGLLQEVFSIIGIILGVFLTFRYMEYVSSYISPYFEEGASYIPFISATIIFVGTLVVVNVAAYLGRKLLETVKLNMLNRLAGAFFGILKSGIIISAILLILAGFNIPSQQSREASLSYPYIIYLAPWSYDVIATIYPGAENFTSTVQKTLQQYNPIEQFPFLEENRNS